MIVYITGLLPNLLLLVQVQQSPFWLLLEHAGRLLGVEKSFKCEIVVV